ncbi:M56 family metallopeptidase [Gordonia aichiensis]|uniref:M56 family metallopeptidase n=1 Tax=Gordonia aichiensis TaxID=36820 RepID=UPI0032672410
MTAAMSAAAFVVVLVTAALTGPRLIQAASPALARWPRAAVALLTTTVLVWLIAFVAVGPLFAWLLTGTAAEGSYGACRRCLESSNPWAEPVLDLGIPAFVMLAGPTLLVLGALVVVGARLAAGEISAGQAAARIRERAVVRSISGHRVLVIDDDCAEAFALPAHRGGIVVSEGALCALGPEELDAVLAHEHAHIAQRHHLIAALSRHVGVVLRPVPLIRAVAAAIPLYLEIAADNAARARSGTRPLVSALLRLSADDADRPARMHGTALHAVGPHRIRTLVGDNRPARGRTTVVATSAQSVVLAVLSGSVLLPWLVAMTSGCA